MHAFLFMLESVQQIMHWFHYVNIQKWHITKKSEKTPHNPVMNYFSQAFILVDTKATNLAELRAADKQGKQNTFEDITHLNLLRIHLSKHNYTTVAANNYQISLNKSGYLHNKCWGVVQ